MKTPQQAYNGANQKDRKILLKLFGDEIKPKSIREILETVENAYRINGTTAEKVIPFKNPESSDEIAINAFAKLTQISKALNEGTVFDYNNSNQEKWWCYFVWDTSKSAFVFSGTLCFYDVTFTNVGVRLSYKTREDAEYAGKTFEKEYNEMFFNSMPKA